MVHYINSVPRRKTSKLLIVGAVAIGALAGAYLAKGCAPLPRVQEAVIAQEGKPSPVAECLEDLVPKSSAELRRVIVYGVVGTAIGGYIGYRIGRRSGGCEYVLQ